MGGGQWDADVYKKASISRANAKIDDFSYSVDVKAGKVEGIHPLLNPQTVAGPTSEFAGQLIRESRDSNEHPESIPIAIVFDVTGSMLSIPKTVQKKLADLMDIIIKDAQITDPQILVGAVGDSYSDAYPFQIGQFESDNRFDEQLRSIILEGNGGGQTRESYGLAYYFAAMHTFSDAFAKRGKKGYFFTMGDEAPYNTIKASEIRNIFGMPCEIDLNLKDVVKKAQEKWEIFHLYSMDGSYSDRTDIHNEWKSLLGERVIFVQDSSKICDIIASIILSTESGQKVVVDIEAKGTLPVI